MNDSLKKNLLIPENLHNARLDVALATLLPDFSRSKITSWIKQGCVTVANKIVKPKDKVLSNQEINIIAPLEPVISYQAEDIDLNIVYEDENLIVINKPTNLVVHPASTVKSGTLLNALLNHCSSLNLLPRAGIVHRLDKDTTGLMVIAKDNFTYNYLIREIKNRNVIRLYRALVYGDMIAGRKIDAPIGRSKNDRTKMAVRYDGKEALTEVRVLQHFPNFAYLQLKLQTGRTHQIRVHLAHILHPIIGDKTYCHNPRKPKGGSQEFLQVLQNFPRQALHAHTLEFTHPKSNQLLSFTAPLPEDFNNLLNTIIKEDKDNAQFNKA